ncbi:hypothetical protein [Oerskovia sp. KBS0722]|uniref:hypothetical protein n=1 Tax=Oerskovia sp. KBS0722 TaxID=1179673 RepID=UPI00110F59B9|nr:hypothetical protein [Oerskovia sp. KBS0722]QDW61953.1 hypothetical protein FFI11_004890 [Oerskovia sp. KBS0722]
MRGGDVLSAVLGAALVAGCGGNGSSGPAAVTLGEAPEHYGAVLADVREVVDDQAGPREWTSVERAPIVWEVAEGRCPFWTPWWRAEEPISIDGSWAQVIDTLDAVLTEHGFHALHENESPTGGWAFLSAEDANGAVLTLRSTEHTEVGVSGGSVLRGEATQCPGWEEG